jgi:thymidylate synthase (FAD)
MDIFRGGSIKCLDHGSVTLMDMMPRIVPEGRDAEIAIVKTARTSLGLDLRSKEEDDKLVKYLIKNKHTSPLEHVMFTFKIVCPLFVSVHFLRHRTGKFNQLSQRYTKAPEYFYKFSDRQIRENSKKNKQSSEVISSDKRDDLTDFLERYDDHMAKSVELYNEALDRGIAREQARCILPQSIYTEMIMTMDLHNLKKMLDLRMSPEAQEETRIFASAIHELVKDYVPNVL